MRLRTRLALIAAFLLILPLAGWQVWAGALFLLLAFRYVFRTPHWQAQQRRQRR